MLVRSILAAVALMAVAPLPALAQGRALPVYADATIREWAPEYRDMVNDNYRRMILNQLSPAEAQRLRGLKWEFPADPAQVLFDFYARGDGTIVLPVASLLLLKDLATAEARSEEHTSELQSRLHLVCRLLLEKKKKTANS